MEQLKVIGTEDDRLVLATESGDRFSLPVDEVLRNELRRTRRDRDHDGQAARPSPREIQSHIRAGLSTTEVATLLEFVAWVVLCDVPATARSANWFKGRGGFLADQLDAVREASIRIQVPVLSCNHHPFS